MKRQALGRGIRAIIPEQTQTGLESESRMVRIEEIRPNPYQPRQGAEEDIGDLAASIRETGMLQPIILRRRRDGYEVVAGERRFRAAKQAGLDSIPAVVRNVTEREMLVLALVENIQRRDLNPIDEAGGFRRLIDEFNLTQEAIAQLLGKDRSTVANALRLLSLPYKVRDLLAAGQLSAGHARALLALSSRRDQVELAERIVQQGLSVRAVEKLCSDSGETPRRRVRPATCHPELSDALQERLGTRVQISEGRGGRGRIVIEYFSHDDLDRLYHLIRGR